MGFSYEYEPMLEAASKMERKLPGLLAGGNWNRIEKIVTIPENVWNGSAAAKYRNFCRIMIHDRNVAGILKAPQMVRDAVENMQTAEQIMAASARKNH